MGDQLPGVVLQSVLARTDASDCARAACVDRRWHDNSKDDELWRDFCLRDLNVSSPLDPQGNPCDSFRATYKCWRESFQEYPMPLVARTKQCLDQMKDWLNVHFVEVLNSMVPGASAKEIEEFEEKLGFPLPDPVRIIYRLCNGQEHRKVFQSAEREDEVSHVRNHLGLLGGYYFYDHFVNVHWLSLVQVVSLTHAIIPQLHLPPGSRRIVIGASCNSLKLIFLDCNDGQVYVGTRNLQVNGEMIPCTPRKDGGVDSEDSMLRWLEWYSHCLRTDMFCVRVDKGIRSISLFPLKPPLCSEAVTRGIKVQSSSVFVPELSTMEDEKDDGYMFSYSIRMNMLPSSRVSGEKSLESAQLSSRHWIVQPEGGVKSEVRAGAVIGMYPFLQAGGEEFSYQSCSNQGKSSGSIEGDFTFVPGRITKPLGAGFPVFVAPFPLEVPQYIF